MVKESFEKAQGLLKEKLPNLDEAVVKYLAGYVSDPPEEEVSDINSYFETFVTPFLLDAGASEQSSKALCERLLQIFPKEKYLQTNSLAKLEENVNSAFLGVSTARFAAKSGGDLEWVKSGRKGISMVNNKKLEKAEAKIKAKMEKRDRKAEYQASRLVNKAMDEEILKVNPILDYTTTKGKSKDIKIEKFDISYAGKRILTDASLTLSFGRRYGLIGRNGIGKSTLLRHLSRRELDIPTHISILHVEQEMIGDETPAMEAVLRADIFRSHLIDEEKSLQEELQSLEDATESTDAEKNNIADKLNKVHAKLLEIEADKAESKVGTILAGLGFSSEQFQWPTRNFSGGWRMRLALARALFSKPDLLLLDEPTNMLDIPAVAWLEAYLKKWPNTLLVVSHDREFLDQVATDILHQQSERLDYYKGNFTQFDATRSERRKNQKREYESQMQYRKHLQDFIDRWRYNANRAAQAQSKIKILEKLPELELPEDDVVVTFRFPDPDAISPPILQMSGVTFGYNPDSILLSDVNIDLQIGTRIAVVGPNGAGKSTMLKLLLGQLEPLKGMVHRHGRLRIAYFSQHHVDQLEMDLSAVAYLARLFPNKNEEEYRRQLGRFGISGMVGLQSIATLSGGQKSRVSFAILAMQNPHILILDEPTNHLDMDSIDALTKALKTFQGGVILVSHDERFIDGVCDEIWVCANGKLVKFHGEGVKDYKKSVLPAEIEL